MFSQHLENRKASHTCDGDRTEGRSQSPRRRCRWDGLAGTVHLDSSKRQRQPLEMTLQAEAPEELGPLH